MPADDPKPEPYTSSRDKRDGDDQLVPVKGGRYESVFHGPPGTDVGDLHCDLEPVGGEGGKILVVNHSGWEPTEEQVHQLGAGAHVRLSLWMYQIPPIAMAIEPPVCSCHGEAMVWDGEDVGYYCMRLSLGDLPSRGAPAVHPLAQAKRDFKPGDPEG